MDMDRDEMINKLEALKPQLAKLLLQQGAHEPDWDPLEKLLMGDFMFMGYYQEKRTYKHYVTRHYLNLDPAARAYQWRGNHYEPLPLELAIPHAFEGLDELTAPWEPRDSTDSD